MSYLTGGVSPHDRIVALKVVRVANAAWIAEGYDTSGRYALDGWDEDLGEYIVEDLHLGSFTWVSAVYESLSPRFRKGVWL